MIKKKIIAVIFCVSLVLGIAALAAGGSESESLVSLSFITEYFQNNFFSKATETANKLQSNAASGVDAALNAYKQSAYSRMDSILAGAVVNRVIEKITSQPELIIEMKTEEVSLYKGDRIVGRPGAGVILQTGTAEICGPANSEVLNITTGSARTPGFDIREGIYYMMVNDDQSGIVITSETATALIKDGAYVLRGYEVQYTRYADILFDLGLFRGTDAGYELLRAPTRQEALIMLVRLLGEEAAALAFDANNMTFKDVVGWEDGKKYIAYGASKKYTNGRSPEVFDQYGMADAYMYLTFVLRALGYTDAGDYPDFIWNTTSVDLAKNIGLLTEEQCNDMLSNGLRRDHVVLISLNAMFKQIKDQDYTLANKLVNVGVITQDQLNAAVIKLLT